MDLIVLSSREGIIASTTLVESMEVNLSRSYKSVTEFILNDYRSSGTIFTIPNFVRNKVRF